MGIPLMPIRLTSTVSRWLLFAKLALFAGPHQGNQRLYPLPRPPVKKHSGEAWAKCKVKFNQWEMTWILDDIKIPFIIFHRPLSWDFYIGFMTVLTHSYQSSILSSLSTKLSGYEIGIFLFTRCIVQVFCQICPVAFSLISVKEPSTDPTPKTIWNSQLRCGPKQKPHTESAIHYSYLYSESTAKSYPRKKQQHHLFLKHHLQCFVSVFSV